MSASEEVPVRQKLYLEGAEIEVWENPEIHFGVGPADLRAYYRQGSWVALFNAMTLASSPDPRA